MLNRITLVLFSVLIFSNVCVLAGEELKTGVAGHAGQGEANRAKAAFADAFMSCRNGLIQSGVISDIHTVNKKGDFLLFGKLDRDDGDGQQKHLFIYTKRDGDYQILAVPLFNQRLGGYSGYIELPNEERLKLGEFVNQDGANEFSVLPLPKTDTTKLEKLELKTVNDSDHWARSAAIDYLTSMLNYQIGLPFTYRTGGRLPEETLSRFKTNKDEYVEKLRACVDKLKPLFADSSSFMPYLKSAIKDIEGL